MVAAVSQNTLPKAAGISPRHVYPACSAEDKLSLNCHRQTIQNYGFVSAVDGITVPVTGGNQEEIRGGWEIFHH